MALIETADEAMLIESLDGLLARSYPVESFRALRDEGSPRRFHEELWQEFVALGLPAVADPEGFGMSGAALTLRTIGRHLAASPITSTVIAANLLVRAGASAPSLPGLLDGSMLAAVALSDQWGEDGVSPLKLDESGDGCVLSGTTSIVPDGRHATLLLAQAESANGPVLTLLDTSSSAVKVEPVDLVDHRDYARFSIDHAAVSPDAIIARGAEAQQLIERAGRIGTLLSAAEQFGIARECFTRTIEYLKTREQFGVRIGSFQALQHRAARLYIDLELAEAVLMKAMRAFDADAQDAGQHISHAKQRVGLTAWRTIDEAVQMHGGIGVTDELDIGLFMKRSRVLGELYGDHRIHAERLARERFLLA
jgi:alkylation response protein AidB-like acyl-CoA dehydrogenase